MRIEMKIATPAMTMLTTGHRHLELPGVMAPVSVDFDYSPATPDSDEGPGDMAQVRLTAIILRESMALHDKDDIATLVISRGADILAFMSARDVDRISEKVLHETLRSEGRAG